MERDVVGGALNTMRGWLADRLGRWRWWRTLRSIRAEGVVNAVRRWR